MTFEIIEPRGTIPAFDLGEDTNLAYYPNSDNSTALAAVSNFTLRLSDGIQIRMLIFGGGFMPGSPEVLSKGRLFLVRNDPRDRDVVDRLVASEVDAFRLRVSSETGVGVGYANRAAFNKDHDLIFSHFESPDNTILPVPNLDAQITEDFYPVLLPLQFTYGWKGLQLRDRAGVLPLLVSHKVSALREVRAELYLEEQPLTKVPDIFNY